MGAFSRRLARAPPAELPKATGSRRLDANKPGRLGADFFADFRGLFNCRDHLRTGKWCQKRTRIFSISSCNIAIFLLSSSEKPLLEPQLTWRWDDLTEIHHHATALIAQLAPACTVPFLRLAIVDFCRGGMVRVNRPGGTGEMVIEPPSPHPLDFDWRYDQQTTGRVAQLVRCESPVIAFGVPSVARLLDREGTAVTLVDRQPLQGVRNHLVGPVEDFDAVAKFRTAVVDPPWYPRQLLNWSRVAARSVGVGGTVFVSVWPDSTRQHAAHELASVLADVSRWASIERAVTRLVYNEPVFETTARAHEMAPQLSRSPLVGELVCLKVRQLPHWIAEPKRQEQWLRFTVDDYQLALRIDTPTAEIGISIVDGANGWEWPYVSARAPCRQQIGLWSSAGEVAAVSDPRALAMSLRNAFLKEDNTGFETALAATPELLSWRIPRPPFRRSIEWQHRQ